MVNLLVDLLHLTLKMAVVVIAGGLLGLVLYTYLPEESGLAILRSDATLMVAYNRIALWICLTAGVVAANTFFVRAAIKGIWLK